MPHTVPGHGGEEGWPVPDPRSPYLDFAPTPSFDIVHGLDNEGGDDDANNDEITCMIAMMVFQKNTTRPIRNRCRKDESKSSIKILQFHNFANANIKSKFRESKNLFRQILETFVEVTVNDLSLSGSLPPL